MLFERRAGLLLHPTSLPGAHGIGALGRHAHAWLDWLASSACTVWQILPMGPTGYGDSPYQTFSGMAGNPLLIDLDELVALGLLTRSDVEGAPGDDPTAVDFGALVPWKNAMLDVAYSRFDPGHELREQFDTWCAGAEWLDDFALFMALKDAHDGRPWPDWPAALRDRDPEALAAATAGLAASSERHAFCQWVFAEQWSAIRRRARALGITIFGDIPLYVAHDSSDVWANRDLFELADDGTPTSVAGVPPDYFSPTGQLWGNPIYRWPAHAASGYGWWINRLRATLDLVDVVRIDHFRGLADYWTVPGDAPTAEVGTWNLGPGQDFFAAIEDALGHLPIVAEDLGDLSVAVHELRDSLGLPGMKITQFAFDGTPDNDFLPHLVEENAVIYTGTHDNDTSHGWLANASESERAQALAYTGGTAETFAADLMQVAWESKAGLAVAPVQDILGLGPDARMNTPGVAAGNWRWRVRSDQLSHDAAAALARLNRATGRAPGSDRDPSS